MFLHSLVFCLSCIEGIFESKKSKQNRVAWRIPLFFISIILLINLASKQFSKSYDSSGDKDIG